MAKFCSNCGKEVNENAVIFSIDNSNIFFVRRAVIGIPIKIRIPNNCACHIITVQINSITIN